MRKDGQLPVTSLPKLALGIHGISLVLLLMLLLSHLRGLTGIQITLCGLALLGWGMRVGFLLALNGAPSQTGHTSNSPADSR